MIITGITAATAQDELEAGLERGDRPTPVRLRRIALQRRLEPEAPDRPGEVDGEGEPDERAGATDDRGDRRGDRREDEGADEHRLLAGVAADPRRRGVADDGAEGGQRQGDAEPRRCRRPACLRAKAIRNMTNPTEPRITIITIEPLSTDGECSSISSAGVASSRATTSADRNVAATSPAVNSRAA